MTIAKAKLYNTAKIINNPTELPDGFQPGEYVAVKFHGRGAFGLNFLITKGNDFTKYSGVRCINENNLEDFVL